MMKITSSLILLHFFSGNNAVNLGNEILKTMNTTQLKKLDFNESFNLDEYIIVDVRMSTEFFHGHIKGAKNIPFEKIDDWLALLKEWNRPVIVCADWENTSRRACKKLEIKGVKAIDGGSWIDLEKKLVKNNLI